MKIEDSDLLPGERVIVSKPANAVIRLEEYGLSRFPADQLMWAIGFAGKEAIGGKLHLTNFRLLFKSHRVNRVTGAFSIYLPTSTTLHDHSRWLVKKLGLGTRAQTFEFVVWGVPAFMARIQQQAAQITAEQARELAVCAAQESGMARNTSLAMDITTFALEALSAVQNPLDAANLLNLLDLVADDVPAGV
jgi:hypothetical protein